MVGVVVHHNEWRLHTHLHARILHCCGLLLRRQQLGLRLLAQFGAAVPEADRWWCVSIHNGTKHFHKCQKRYVIAFLVRLRVTGLLARGGKEGYWHVALDTGCKQATAALMKRQLD